MDWTCLLISYLALSDFCFGLELGSKLKIDDYSADVSDSHNFNETPKDPVKPGKGLKTRTAESKIPFLLSEKDDGFEDQIPLTVEGGTTESLNKIRLFSGSQLFDKSSVATERTTESILPILSGSLEHNKSDFLIPNPYPYLTIGQSQKETNVFGGLWRDRIHQSGNDIKRLNPPEPDKKPWILNTTPFLGFLRNTTSPPFYSLSGLDTQKKVSLWYLLENGALNSRDPFSRDQERRGHQILKQPRSHKDDNYPKYYTRNIIYPPRPDKSHEKPVNNAASNARWITCPPVEVTYDRGTGRQIFPGCS